MTKTKKKEMKRVLKKPAKKGSYFSQIFHKKHRAFHTAGVGIVLVLLKGILAVFATIGIALILISAFALLWKSARAHRS